MARAKLSGALLVQKGATVPTATQRDGERQSVPPAKMSEGQRSTPIALTLKVDQARYEALKVLGSRRVSGGGTDPVSSTVSRNGAYGRSAVSRSVTSLRDGRACRKL